MSFEPHTDVWKVTQLPAVLLYHTLKTELNEDLTRAKRE